MTRKQKRTLKRIIASSLLFIIVSIMPVDRIFKLLLYFIPYLIIGYDVVWSAIRKIFGGQVFDEQFLMSIATFGAFATGEYPEAVAVMLFYQIGELFQGIAVGKSRKSIAALMDICPESAMVLRDGIEIEVEPDEVELGEIILIKPGKKIPLDGIVIEGSSTVNTSALTGESMPQNVQINDKVISGTINIASVIKVRTESKYNDSTVAKILELVENSSEKKARVEGFISRFAKYYTPFVVISAILLALIPPFFTGFDSFGLWINRALIFLVVSCPCALVVSVPLSFFAGIGGASREGILIKGANYLEALSKTDCMVFDKTGTITEGKFTLLKIYSKSLSDTDLLAIAAHAESYSTHPIAKSIVEAYGNDINKDLIGSISEISGKGISAVIDKQQYFLGNSDLMSDINAEFIIPNIIGTAVHISKESEYLGHIVIGDKIKDDSKSAILSLKSLGIKESVMLTGDVDEVAAVAAEAVGIDRYIAKLMPSDKVVEVEKLINENRRVAFVGDGINDAPVLTRADVGIAMGALGSDAAIESADIVLMDDKMSKIPLALKISKKTMSIVKQNIVFALSVKAIILILSAIGKTNMWIAVFGDVGVMVIAILNAMRAMKR